MPMKSSFPDWLTPVAWVLLILAVASAVGIAYDIYGRGHRHTSAAIELVWTASAFAWDRWRWPCTPVTAALARRATLRETLSIRAAPHNRLP